VKFRRQHPIGPYIVDFYAPALNLAVEVYDAERERDAFRQVELERHRVRFLGIAAAELARDFAGCLQRIREATDERG